MKLHCADILHQLRHKPVILTSPPLPLPRVAEINDAERRAALLPLLPVIHQAQKYWFDSGSDQDEQTVRAVRETALNMMEAGIFHLPHPAIWIEDPFDADDPTAPLNCYLCVEKPGRIEISHFTEADPRYTMAPGPQTSKMPKLSTHSVKMVIDLLDPADTFMAIDHTDTPRPCDDLYAMILGEAVYSVKKLIVTLATRGTLTEKTHYDQRQLKKLWNGDPRTRPYDHTVVRIPTGEPERDETGRIIAGRKPPRLSLVAGYSYGKNTRPLAEQRWVWPYWRGHADQGIKGRSHYVVN